MHNSSIILCAQRNLHKTIRKLIKIHSCVSENLSLHFTTLNPHLQFQGCYLAKCILYHQISNIRLDAYVQII